MRLQKKCNSKVSKSCLKTKIEFPKKKKKTEYAIFNTILIVLRSKSLFATSLFRNFVSRILLLDFDTDRYVESNKLELGFKDRNKSGDIDSEIRCFYHSIGCG